MTLGLGVDVVCLAGFRDQLADPASRFVFGVFTQQERATAAEKPGADPAPHLAGRFAAKEAFVKAWSSAHFGHPPSLGLLDLREVEVVNDAYGRPSLRLHGAVARAMERLGPVRVLVSLSHDGPVAMAQVLLEQA